VGRSPRPPSSHEPAQHTVVPSSSCHHRPTVAAHDVLSILCLVPLRRDAYSGSWTIIWRIELTRPPFPRVTHLSSIRFDRTRNHSICSPLDTPKIMRRSSCPKLWTHRSDSAVEACRISWRKKTNLRTLTASFCNVFGGRWWSWIVCYNSLDFLATL
jgi:hypothetical protein